MKKIALLLGLVSVATVCAAAEAVRLGNRLLQLGFEPEHGGLIELLEPAMDRNQAGTPRPGEGLWEADLESGGKIFNIAAAHARSFKVTSLKGPGGVLLLSWNGFEPPAAAGLSVEATVRLQENEPVSRWGLAFHGLQKVSIRQVRFPRIFDVPRREQERLAVPMWLGQETAEPRKVLAGKTGKGTRLEWAYPGLLSLQCLAFYEPDVSGLYFACDDTAAYRKAFGFFADADGRLGCEAVHYPEKGAPASTWSLPYQMVLGTLKGDWTTAAERYRSWATNQVWARQSRLQRGLVPSWVQDTGLWVWNRGRSDAVLTPAVALQREAGLPVSVFWHWWHGCAYDSGFPEYLPPREGAGGFQSALSQAHAEGVHALVYMNQRLWGMNTGSWGEKGAERYAVKAADGKVRPEVYNTFTQAPCATMCMGTRFWRDQYVGLARQAISELGVDGIYMDQACTSLACYDPAHGHPLGGGRYWMQGFQRLAQQVRQKEVLPDRGAELLSLQNSLGGSRVVLAGEGCGEPWLPDLDLMLSLQVSKERYTAPDGWETIPFFNAVYHPFVLTYGNYSSLTMPPYDELWPAQFAPAEPLKLLDRKFSRQFYLEQARAFVWGQQPTIANFLPVHLRQRPEELEYVLRLARIRSQARQYLVHGTFLRMPELNAPMENLDISRLSIYAGQQGGLTVFQKQTPVVVGGAWRAPRGTLALAVASISDSPVKLSCTLPSAVYGLSPTNLLFRLDETGRKELGVLEAQSGSALLEIQLCPRDACLLEVEPGRHSALRR